MLLKILRLLVMIYTPTAFGGGFPEDLLGDWYYAEIRCLSDGKKANLFEQRVERFSFSESGEVQRSLKSGDCEMVFDGQYQIHGNRLSTIGKSSACRSESLYSSPNKEIEFAIKNDRLHIIWRDGSTPSSACADRGLVEVIYVKVPVS